LEKGFTSLKGKVLKLSLTTSIRTINILFSSNNNNITTKCQENQNIRFRGITKKILAPKDWGVAELGHNRCTFIHFHEQTITYIFSSIFSI